MRGLVRLNAERADEEGPLNSMAVRVARLDRLPVWLHGA